MFITQKLVFAVPLAAGRVYKIGVQTIGTLYRGDGVVLFAAPGQERD